MNLLATALSVTPIPEPVIDDTWYSPGVIGFIATFAVVAGAVLLIFDMVRRIRRVRYRAEVKQKLSEEMGDLANGSSPGDAGSYPSSSQETFRSPKPRAKPDRPAPPSRPNRD